MNFQERVTKAGKLRETFLEKGVRWLATDLDDTVVDTSELYVSGMQTYSQNITIQSSLNPNPSMEIVWDFMKEVLNGLRSTYNVHPNLMQETARVTALRYGCNFYSEDLREPTEQLMRIYESVPPLFSGVHETLETIEETGIKVGAITNSDQQWTDRKLAKNGLYQTFDRVINIPSHIPKDKRAWVEVFDSLEANVREVLVVGDSWSSDIRPVLELGVPPENVVRVRTSDSHANQGGVSGIREVDRFEQVINVWLGREGII